MTLADCTFLLIHVDVARQIDVLETYLKAVKDNELLKPIYDED